MTTLREAAQQALDALEQLQGGCTDHDDGTVEAITVWCPEIIDALRAALAEQPAEQEPVNIGPEWAPCVKLPVTVHVRHQRPGETHVSTREGITPVKPDDLIMRGAYGEEYPIGREIFERTYRLGEAPQPAKPAEQEPVAWIDITDEGQIVSSPRMYSDGSREERPLYTAPQPAKQPLTDEQIVQLLGGVRESITGNVFFAFARAVERAHGIGEIK